MTEPNHELITPIERWVEAVDDAGILNAPQDFLVGYGAVHRSIGRLLETANPEHAPSLLTALAACEFVMAERPDFTEKFGLPPIQPLPAGWLGVVDDGSAEFRLAASLSALRPIGLDASSDVSARVHPLRAHLEPVDYRADDDLSSSVKWDFKASKEVIWDKESDVDGLNAIFSARLKMWDGSTSEFGQSAIHARLDDIGRFLRGETDEAKLSRLCFELSLVDAWRLPEDPWAKGRLAAEPAEVDVDQAYALAKLCYSGRDVPLNRDIHLLANRGDLDTAIEFGGAHLRKHGVDVERGAIDSDLDARRIAAALLFPISDEQRDVQIRAM